MSLNDLIAQAQQGDAQAIARLITRSLAAEGIVARARWQQRHLHLRLESDQAIAASQVIPRLQQGFQRLSMACPVVSVQVGSYGVGQDQPRWIEAFTPTSEAETAPEQPSPAEATRPLPVSTTLSPPEPVPDSQPESPPSPPFLSDAGLVSFCHLVPLFSYLFLLGDLWVSLPWFWGNTFLLPWRVMLPLVVLLVQNQPGWVRQNAREALNFQISTLIYWLVTFALIRLLVGFLLVIPLAVVETVIVIIAAVQAGEGKPFRYPLCIRFVQE